MTTSSEDFWSDKTNTEGGQTVPGFLDSNIQVEYNRMIFESVEKHPIPHDYRMHFKFRGLPSAGNARHRG